LAQHEDDYPGMYGERGKTESIEENPTVDIANSPTDRR
jgi:hypothetical protein